MNLNSLIFLINIYSWFSIAWAGFINKQIPEYNLMNWLIKSICFWRFLHSSYLNVQKEAHCKKKYVRSLFERRFASAIGFILGRYVAQKFEEWKSKEKFFHRLSNCVKLHMRHHSFTSFKLLSFPRLLEFTSLTQLLPGPECLGFCFCVLLCNYISSPLELRYFYLHN